MSAWGGLLRGMAWRVGGVVVSGYLWMVDARVITLFCYVPVEFILVYTCPAGDILFCSLVLKRNTSLLYGSTAQTAQHSPITRHKAGRPGGLVVTLESYCTS